MSAMNLSDQKVKLYVNNQNFVIQTISENNIYTIEHSSNYVNINGKLISYNDASFLSNVDICGNLEVGNITVGNINVVSASFEDIDISGFLHLLNPNKLFIVEPDASFNKNVDISGNLLINGNLIVSDSNNHVDFYSDVSFNKNIEITNTVYATSLSGTLLTPFQPNVTNVGILNDLSMSGDIYLNQNDLSSVGTVYATSLSGTLLTPFQPNVTNVGILNDLSMGGDIYLNQNDLSSVGTVYATSLSGTLLTPAQPNITSVGNLNNLHINGILSGPSTFIIDPSGIGNNTGLVVIRGGLQIDGSSTIVNSSIVDISDHRILLASSATLDSERWGAGIEVTGNKTFTYEFDNQWTSNINIEAPLFIGDISGNITAANLAGTLTTPFQPNITNVGILNDLSMNGDIYLNQNDISSVNTIYATSLSGTLLTPLQPNITSVGQITINNAFTMPSTIGISGQLLKVSDINSTTLEWTNINDLVNLQDYSDASFGNVDISGNLRFTDSTKRVIIEGDVSMSQNLEVYGDICANRFIGDGSLLTGLTNGTQIVGTTLLSKIGQEAYSNTSINNLILGYSAGNNNMGSNNIFIGTNTGNNTPLNKNQIISIGYGAGRSSNTAALSFGNFAGSTNQGARSICIGNYAGYSNAGEESICIGHIASNNNSGNFKNYIILNAEPFGLNPSASNAFFVKPIRNFSKVNALYYDTDSGEITYDLSGGNTIITNYSDASFGNVDISGNLRFTDSTKRVIIEGDVSMSQNLEVYGDICANRFIGDGSLLTGLTNFQNYSDASFGNVDISGNLRFTDSTKRVIIEGDVSMSQNLEVYGDISATRFIGDGSLLTGLDNLQDYSDASFGNVDISGQLDICGNVDICGNTFIYGNLEISGNVDISGLLFINGNPNVVPAQLEASILEYLTLTDGVASGSETLYDILIDICNSVILQNVDNSFQNVDISGDLRLTNPTKNVIIEGNVSMNKNLDVSGILKVNGVNTQEQFTVLEDSILEYLTLTDGTPSSSQTLYQILQDLCNNVVINQSDTSLNNLDISGILRFTEIDALNNLRINNIRQDILLDNLLLYDTGSNEITFGDKTTIVSDERVKYNIKELDNSIELIRYLEPKSYIKAGFNATENDIINGKKQVGFIAQDILKINNEKATNLVIGGDYLDESNNLIINPYSVKYNDIMVYGINAIKQLDKQQIDLSNQLINKIEKIEKENKLLKEKLEELYKKFNDLILTL